MIYEGSLLEVDMNTKLTQLHKSVQNYENFKTQDNEISWLTRDDEQQITWAMNYIAKCGLYSIDESFKGITPYDKLLLILDSYCREQTIYRTVFIEKMRKSWTQYKYRSAGKTKKNYHIPLTKSSKEKLSKLSDLMNISENKLLEKLINEKYESLATDHHGNFKF